MQNLVLAFIMSLVRSFGRTNSILCGVLFICLFLTTYNIRELHKLQQSHIDLAHPESALSGEHPRYTVYAKNPDSGFLKHVYNILERAGYGRVSYNTSSDWDIMWAHDYPFTKLRSMMLGLKPHQRVNKLPGSGFVTNKVNLATTSLEHIPPAFRIPNDTEKLKQYAEDHPSKMFVQKNQNHRGIKIEKLDKLDLKSPGSFVQEFVDDPFLIDGYKFDIGIYTTITSIDPLRIYIYNGDALLRFCPQKYYPFDPANRDKYVVHDDYRPTWEVPTLARLYSDLGFTFKETLNSHIRSLGKEPEKLWTDIEDVIRSVYTLKEADFIKAGAKYSTRRSFFEMVRFDFVMDANMNVYLMEVNMSPNLSSKHFAGNRLLYEQVVYSVLRLVGVSRPGVVSNSLQTSSKEVEEMQVSDKDLFVSADDCVSQRCSKSDACDDFKCRLCKHCLADDDIDVLRAAYLEHRNRHASKRVYPKEISQEEAVRLQSKDQDPWSSLSPSNAKMQQWFVGKCIHDKSWC